MSRHAAAICVCGALTAVRRQVALGDADTFSLTPGVREAVTLPGRVIANRPGLAIRVNARGEAHAAFYVAAIVRIRARVGAHLHLTRAIDQRHVHPIGHQESACWRAGLRSTLANAT